MSGSPLESVPAPTRRLRNHAPVFKLLGELDDHVYDVERGLVTGAMLIMSGAVCLNIFYQFLKSQAAVWSLIQAGEQGMGALVPSLVLLVVSFVIGRSIAAATPSLASNTKAHWLAGLGSGAGTLILAWSMLNLESYLVVAALTVLAILGLLKVEWSKKAAGGFSALRFATFSLAGLVGVYYATLVPAEYSWTQKLALFLLLWVAFIGASMATHDRRHLTIDAIRKAIPESKLPYFNALSNVVAAIFTIGFLYVAVIYWQDRLAETTTAGEIPDWLKVLAIPTALAMMTVRFLGIAIAEALVGWLQLPPTQEELDAQAAIDELGSALELPSTGESNENSTSATADDNAEEVTP